MKAIVETTSNIMLVDAGTKDFLPEDRPAVMTMTQFLQTRIGKGDVRVLAADLPNEANDADFVEYLKDAEKTDLAIASYVSSFQSSDREELEARANELKIKFRSNISDEGLAEKIAEAEAAKAEG